MNDPKYDHWTGKTFTPKNIPEKNTNHGEASPQKAIDWGKEMEGWEKPYEAHTDSLDRVTEKDDGDGTGR